MRKLVIVLFSLLVGLSLAQQNNADATLLQGLSENEDFSTLVSLIDQVGLTADLEGAGPFTILAPTNSVFEELDETVLEQLNNDPELLTSVLQSHVLQGVYTVNDLQDAEEGSITTLQGEPLETDLTAGGLTVGGASINSTDVENTYVNGILHEVGGLVLPASLRNQVGLENVEEATEAVTTEGVAFGDLDADADGSLTEEEFAGGYDAGLFGDYDADADGLITEDEFNAYTGDAGVGAGVTEAEAFEPTRYQAFGEAEVGEYGLVEGYEPGVNDAEFEELGGNLIVRTVSPSDQGVDVVLIGPDAYKEVLEVAEEQVVEGLVPGTYILVATDDELAAVSTKVDVTLGRIAPVTLVLNEVEAIEYDPALYEPYGAYEVGPYEPIETADVGDLTIIFPEVAGFEDAEIVGSIVGPDDFREDIDGATETVELTGLRPGQYIIAFSREGGDLVEGVADVQAGQAASVTMTFAPFGGAAVGAGMDSMAFRDFDTDADGFISEEEFVGVYDDPALFGEVDADADGFISEEEFAANEGLFE